MSDILTITEHQEVNVKKLRDIKQNIISFEDRELLFDIVYTDKNSKNRDVFSHKGKNKIKANAIVGSISLKTGLTIEILPKFAKGILNKESIEQHREMLLKMIRVSNERNFINSSSQSSKISANEMPLLNYIIELFSDDLLKNLRSGVYKTYNKIIENSSHIRGNILLSKTIQNNIIDKSRVYSSYNKHSSNNLLMQIFKTLSTLLLQDHNLSYTTKQNLYEITLLLGDVATIQLNHKDFERIIFNRLNDKFEILFKQSKFIFSKYMPFSSHINTIPFWSILFNMDYLFEKFCAYLFRKSDIETQEQSLTNCFINSHYTVSAKPDFILSNENNKIVVDAKWKILSDNKTLYGLDAQNFWQLFSYMNLLDNAKEIRGYFIVPKNSDNFNEEIHFEPIIEGNKSITILSIDFSLSFEELVEKYRFKIVDDELQLSRGFNKIKIVDGLEKDFKRLVSNNNLDKKHYIKNLTEKSFISKYPYLSDLLSHISDESFKSDRSYYINDFSKLSKTSITKIFDIMREDEDSGIDVDLIFDYLIKTPNTKIAKGNKKREHKNKSWKNQSKLSDKSKNYIEEDLNPIVNSHDEKNIDVIEEKSIIFNPQEVKKYYSNNHIEIISFVNDESLIDEYKIILFYREYTQPEIKNEVQNILKINSSKDLKKLFETPIRILVDTLEEKFKQISLKYLSWIRGLVYCDNNSALFKVKSIVAKLTTNKEIAIKLSEETDERKILFSLLSNFNRDNHGYVIDNDILYKIFRLLKNSLQNSDCSIYIAILNRHELEYKLFKDIIEHCKYEINFDILNDNNYHDKSINKFILENLNVEENKQQEQRIIKKEITILEEYLKLEDEDRIDFIDNVNFNLVDNELIEYIIDNEKNIDRLEDFTYNPTLPLKYLLLVYNNNLDKHSEEISRLKENIEKRDIQLLNKLINLNIFLLENTIEKEFKTIDKEILLGYAMTDGEKFYRIRERISQITNDFDILDELSKHRGDKKVLNNIIYKTKNDDSFFQKIKNKQTKYSTETLDRISKYNEYYQVNDNTCLFITLIHNWNICDKTREYLFETYIDDKILLEALRDNHCSYDLENKINDILNTNEEKDTVSYDGMNRLNMSNFK